MRGRAEAEAKAKTGFPVEKEADGDKLIPAPPPFPRKGAKASTNAARSAGDPRHSRTRPRARKRPRMRKITSRKAATDS